MPDSNADPVAKNNSAPLGQQLTILSCMYAGYGAMMVSRQMVTILSPALVADPALNFNVKNVGDILAYGTLGAMVGKVIWGPVADRIGGRLTFLIGIVLTALLVVLFGLSHQMIAFTSVAALLYCTKSSGWPGMTKIVGNWYAPAHYGRVWSVLSTSSRASVVVGTLFFGWLLAFFDWRTVAFVAAFTALAIYSVCRFFLRERPASPPHIASRGDTQTTAIAARPHPLDGTTLRQGLVAFARSRRCWLVVLMLMALTCAMALLDFVPVYLMEVYHLSSSRASMLSSVMPLGSLIGLIASILLYDRFSKQQLRFVLSGALVIATLAVLGLQCVPHLPVPTRVAVVLAVGCIILFGIMTSPAYYIPMSIFSIEFGGPHSATLVCLIDMCGFAASATFGFVAGRLAAGSGGWTSFMTLMAGIGVAATVFTWAFMHGEYKAATSFR